MLSARVGVVAGREVVEEFGVARQAAARVIPLDQVVAQDLVLGKRLAGGCLESVNVVDPLSREASQAEKVHVSVRRRRRVRIDPSRCRQQSSEPRVRGGDQVEAHPRLEHAVAGNHPPLQFVEAGGVQRMSQRSHEPSGTVARELSVGIERDDDT